MSYYVQIPYFMEVDYNNDFLLRLRHSLPLLLLTLLSNQVRQCKCVEDIHRSF